MKILPQRAHRPISMLPRPLTQHHRSLRCDPLGRLVRSTAAPWRPKRTSATNPVISRVRKTDPIDPMTYTSYAVLPHRVVVPQEPTRSLSLVRTYSNPVLVPQKKKTARTPYPALVATCRSRELESPRSPET